MKFIHTFLHPGKTAKTALLAGLLLWTVLPVTAAETPGHGGDITHRMMVLVLQIGIIIFAGYIGARFARRFRFPTILGELIAGILIGPFLFGRIPLPGFPFGLFQHSGGSVAVSPELFGFAMVASIVLLFLSGLQTDLKLFLRFAVKGSLVGIGGAAVSLLAGLYIGSLVLDGQWLHPSSFFLGVVAIATSVDITARILSDRRKMASPEGVTILAASVIEDVIGITLLAVLIGIDTFVGDAGVAYGAIMGVAVRALMVWLGFMGLGILLAQRISRLLKFEPNHSQIAVLALGMALVVAGLFETAGLAMIIGAYVVGISLSNTDLAYVIQEKIEVIHHFFDPIFFTVMGMIINLELLISLPVLGFGFLFGIIAIAAKVVGCGVPAYAAGFTGTGSLRISLGMMPRGEVALIIAGIGISTGLIDDMLFGIVILMTLITTIAAPPFFSRAISSKRRGTRAEVERSENVPTDFEFGSRQLTDFLLGDLLQTMRNEGFYIHAAEMEQRMYHMRKEMVYITLMATDRSLHFSSAKEDVTFINNLVYESILTLQNRVDHLRTISKPVELQRTLVEKDNRTTVNWYQVLDIDCISLKLRSREKEAIITELVEVLQRAGKLNDRDAVLRAVIEREKSMSTGMQHGIAIPHGRSEGANELCVAVGIAPQGVDFASLDGKPTKLVFLIVSPERDPGPHLQVLSGIAGVLNSDEAVEAAAVSPSRADLISFMVQNSRH
ncbi:cation:proton antiporter [Spirochaeta africana]|uniref:Kef-type K+ transport system, membrane component n=1 Tax=Spirochaeta africana (strain ATCC 700263 / DSM 8902 / Z-7692) TaxID=889378 RepID=H9UJY0_SPIAZ|nr:cation:proton antiporter [Spirochaeta africana]AFG37823.1 Kef-type K+ transport system, membrane component [Spirochaeta africana DSM 8902]